MVWGALLPIFGAIGSAVTGAFGLERLSADQVKVDANLQRISDNQAKLKALQETDQRQVEQWAAFDRKAMTFRNDLISHQTDVFNLETDVRELIIDTNALSSTIRKPDMTEFEKIEVPDEPTPPEEPDPWIPRGGDSTTNITYIYGDPNAPASGATGTESPQQPVNIFLPDTTAAQAATSQGGGFMDFLPMMMMMMFFMSNFGQRTRQANTPSVPEGYY